MTPRQFELIALALALAYGLAFFATRKPVCLIERGSASYRGPSVSCQPPPAPNYERRHPNERIVMADGPDRWQA